ncbi:MFS multidrug transporter [Stipitochalara longipes BDJ]|nr:MFS multidrug transporter [Stipitochalara longipes BDJ]
MAVSNGTFEPDERTALLNGSASNHIVPSIGDAIKPVVNANADGDGSKSGIDDGDEADEAGDVTEENPLFQGDEEMRKKLYILFPGKQHISFLTRTNLDQVFLIAADQTIIVSSYARIGTELNALNNTSWIATAYFLTLTSFQPLYGKLSDIFGRKPCLLFAYSVFGLGCLFCGVARNLQELVAARAFAGIGGGGMTTVIGSILFSDIIPLRERGTWQGYMNIVFATGFALGGPLGGVLSDTIGWRLTFSRSFIGQFPLSMLASVVVYSVLDLPKPEDSHWKDKLRRIDFLGAFSLVIAVFCLLVGLDRGSNVSWSDTIAIVFTSASTPLFALFIFIEMKVASNPFAPGHIIFERSLFASYLSNFFAIAANTSFLFYLPLYFQAVDGISAAGSGLRLIPAAVGSVSGSLFGGTWMQKTGKYYWLTTASTCVTVVGSTIIFLCSGPLFNSTWGMLFGVTISCFGGGAVITTTLVNVIANANPSDQAIATACTYLFRSLGSVVGVSMAATIVQQSLRTQLRASLKDGKDADKIVERVRQSLDYIKELEPHTRAIVIRCYQKAENASFGVSVLLVCGTLLCVVFISEKKLSR